MQQVARSRMLPRGVIHSWTEELQNERNCSGFSLELRGGENVFGQIVRLQDK